MRQVTRSAAATCAIALAAVVATGACASRARPRPDDAAGAAEAPPPRGKIQRGKASWYGKRFQGRKTASGERFDRHAMTAAHKTLPFGTRVRVTHPKSGRSVVVRINDRGPYARGRIVDLSEEAARRLGMIEAGVVPVTLEVIGRGQRPAARRAGGRQRGPALTK
jgi:rare lipoprotein A